MSSTLGRVLYDLVAGGELFVSIKYRKNAVLFQWILYKWLANKQLKYFGVRGKVKLPRYGAGEGGNGGKNAIISYFK